MGVGLLRERGAGGALLSSLITLVTRAASPPPVVLRISGETGHLVVRNEATVSGGRSASRGVKETSSVNMASLKAKGGGALPPIADRVVIGVCDIAGVGVRAIMGMKASDGSQATTHELELHGVGARSGSGGGGGGGGGEDAPGVSGGAVFTAGGDPDLAEGTPEIALMNVPGLTLIAVNTSLSVAEEAPFAAAVHALVADAGCSSVVLVGALRLNVKGEGKIFQTVMNGCQPLSPGGGGGGGDATPFEELDGDVVVNDGVIAAIMHVMRATATPASFLFTHGYRVPKLGGEAEEEAAAAADKMGTAAAAALGCRYANKGLAAVEVWHEDLAAPKNTDRMYM